MRQSYGIAIAAVIGFAAVAAPIFISVQLSWKEGLADESSLTLSYAEDALRRTNEMAAQMARAINLLAQFKGPFCSNADIDTMRQIDVASSYIQAVGRIEGDQLICTSLGTRDPISLGSPTLITARGAAERLNVRLPIAGYHLLDVFSMNGIAFLLDPTLPLDIPTEGPSISMAIFVPSSPNHAIIAARAANLRPEWFRTIPKGGRVTFRSSGYVVAIVRSADTDVAVITAAPESYVQRHTQHFALIFIPIGLICACLLGWAITHISLIRFSLPSVLRSAAKRKEFFVEYQPIVDLRSRRWIGAEALVRWKRSGGRLVPPESFIPAAEQSGVITCITRCVAEIVTGDLPEMLQVDPDFFVALNLSVPDLLSAETVELLAGVIDGSGAHPANVRVEATERGFLQNETRDLLSAIRDLGIAVAIDDFGTGYSSLACIQTLRLDALKIDKTFVETIDTDGATSQVVPHIIGMAQSLELIMVAEGVETEAQAKFLERRGVQHAQGWLFGRPMSLASLCAELKSHAERKNESMVQHVTR